MKKLYRWQLKDIIMVAIISLFFAVVYLGAVYLASVLGAALAPFGLSPFANEIIFGVWFMAATLAAYILQKPGVAIVAEMLAALLEVLMGNFYGPIVFVSGFLQGLGAEMGFAAFRYRRFDMASVCLASFGSCVTSFIWGFFRSGFGQLNPALLLGMFAVRAVSSLLFAGVLVKLCGDRLSRSGVLKAYPLGAAATVPSADKQ